MASLKDLRNRIAATKATQKITKAMQMVAVSKLRRAQAAAEAARPYASRMDTVLGNIAASVAALENAPRLLRGTDSDQKHLLLVFTAERGLCGPFNSAIVRLARNLAVQIFRALLENAASFYGAQMSAMDNATRNAGDMIRRQTLFYNRTRQAMITKELIEIISGAEAL